MIQRVPKQNNCNATDGDNVDICPCPFPGLNNQRQSEAMEAFKNLPKFGQIIVIAVDLRRTTSAQLNDLYIKNGMPVNNLSFPTTRIIKPELFSEALKEAMECNLENINDVLKKFWAFSLSKKQGKLIIQQGSSMFKRGA